MKIPRKPRLIIKKDVYKYIIKFITPFEVEVMTPEGKTYFSDIFSTNIKLFAHDREKIKIYFQVHYTMKDNKYLNYTLKYFEYLNHIKERCNYEQDKIFIHHISSNRMIKVK